jgi:hypothetical protein
MDPALWHSVVACIERYGMTVMAGRKIEAVKTDYDREILAAYRYSIIRVAHDEVPWAR